MKSGICVRVGGWVFGVKVGANVCIGEPSRFGGGAGEWMDV